MAYAKRLGNTYPLIRLKDSSFTDGNSVNDEYKNNQTKLFPALRYFCMGMK
jgi:hypothetical protein